MATCLKRSVLGAGNRPERVQAAASTVKAATQRVLQRVAPHSGAGRMGPLSHGGQGSTLEDAIREIARAVDAFVQSITDHVAAQAAEDRAAALATSTEAKVQLHVVYQAYSEPMEIPAPVNMSLAAVQCARAVLTASPNTVLINGSSVEWSMGSGGILVRSIDGMTPSAAIITWTFVYYGV